jgi:hypothetical protein
MIYFIQSNYIPINRFFAGEHGSSIMFGAKNRQILFPSILTNEPLKKYGNVFFMTRMNRIMSDVEIIAEAQMFSRLPSGEWLDISSNRNDNTDVYTLLGALFVCGGNHVMFLPNHVNQEDFGKKPFTKWMIHDLRDLFDVKLKGDDELLCDPRTNETFVRVWTSSENLTISNFPKDAWIDSSIEFKENGNDLILYPKGIGYIRFGINMNEFVDTILPVRFRPVWEFLIYG